MLLWLLYFWLSCKVKDLAVIKNPPTLLTKNKNVSPDSLVQWAQSLHDVSAEL